MANNFLNTNWVFMDTLRLLPNKLEVAEYFNRSWERDFEKEFAPGAAITVKFPERFFTSDGLGYAPQGVNRISTTVSLDQWIQIAFEWDDYERAVTHHRYSHSRAAAKTRDIRKTTHRNSSSHRIPFPGRIVTAVRPLHGCIVIGYMQGSEGANDEWE